MSDNKKAPIGRGLISLSGKKPPAKQAGKGSMAKALAGGKRKSGELGKKFKVKGVGSVAMEAIKQGGDTRQDTGYLGYIIDATASRQHTWQTAQEIQREMFLEIDKVGNLWARVVSFGGQHGHVNDLGWKNKAQPIADEMAKVSCNAGHTNMFGSVKKLVDGPQDFLPQNIVMIGDCCEEPDTILRPAIEMLKQRNIRVFSFHEGSDHAGERAYRAFADETGGVFEKFGPTMPLKDLCTAVGVYTVGSKDALERLMRSNEKVRRIGSKILKLTDGKGSSPRLNGGPR